ncbi:MAG TPA: hypothetical protein VMV26_13000 [Alphaproteobacteria bacterium]|nr:hypothetical protein [Alphaproteobacteria bacterium]
MKRIISRHAHSASLTGALARSADFGGEVAMVTFGRTPGFQSSDEIDFSVSDDGRAFTVNFVGAGFQFDTAQSQEPITTRQFSLAVPIEGDDDHVEIEFSAGTNATLIDGGTAIALLSVNGQSAVTALAAEEADQAFQTTLTYSAPRPKECRLTFMLLGGRDSQNANSEALASTLSIDAEILPRPPGPEGPPVPPPER